MNKQLALTTCNSTFKKNQIPPFLLGPIPPRQQFQTSIFLTSPRSPWYIFISQCVQLYGLSHFDFVIRFRNNLFSHISCTLLYIYSASYHYFSLKYLLCKSVFSLRDPYEIFLNTCLHLLFLKGEWYPLLKL
jgi:hypothetical protein